jgi:NAD(P)-dependent dehydrogenase (short-subunit alcohol dehydrogenase family)
MLRLSLLALTKSAAQEYAARGIRINALERRGPPDGPVGTLSHDTLWRSA